jgi:hypothetical protein
MDVNLLSTTNANGDYQAILVLSLGLLGKSHPILGPQMRKERRKWCGVKLKFDSATYHSIGCCCLTV